MTLKLRYAIVPLYVWLVSASVWTGTQTCVGALATVTQGPLFTADVDALVRWALRTLLGAHLGTRTLRVIYIAQHMRTRRCCYLWVLPGRVSVASPLW